MRNFFEKMLADKTFGWVIGLEFDFKITLIFLLHPIWSCSVSKMNITFCSSKKKLFLSILQIRNCYGFLFKRKIFRRKINKMLNKRRICWAREKNHVAIIWFPVHDLSDRFVCNSCFDAHKHVGDIICKRYFQRWWHRKQCVRLFCVFFSSLISGNLRQTSAMEEAATKQH